MSGVAILGAGAIGAAVAHRLAERARVGSVLLVDASADAAKGKALDIQQSGPVDGFDTRVSSAGHALGAVGADVIVVADTIKDGEWTGDAGLELVRQLVRAGSTAPLVFAGASQIGLMEAAYRDVKIDRQRLVGTAASAIAGAAQAIAALEIDVASVDVTVVGRPPAFVVNWSTASAAGSLLIDRVPAYRLLAIGRTVNRMWPPGPQATGAATARIVEALIFGSRRHHPAMTIVDGELGARSRAVMLPLELGQCRVLSHVIPSLSPQERNELINAIG